MAISAQESYATLQNLHYQVYSDKGIQNVFPDHAILQKRVKFVKQELVPNGQFFNRAVPLKRPQGGTFSPPNVAVPDLNPSQAGKIENAQIQPSSITWRETLGYDDAARAMKGKTAYLDATKHVMQQLIEQATSVYEANLMWGQHVTGIGDFSAVSTTTGTITLAEWAPGVFTGQEDMPVEIFNAAGTVRRGSTSISAINLDTRVFTFADNIADMGAVAGDVLWRYGTKTPGATSFNEAAGLGKICTNTGTLFGIDGSTSTGYALWRPYQQTTTSAMSFVTAQRASANGLYRGQSRNTTLLVTPLGWVDMLQNAEALRRYGKGEGGSGTVEVGGEELKFHGVNGVMTVIAHPMQKQGKAFLIDNDSDIWERVGNQNWTFRPPGSELLVRDLPNANGYEYRLYSNTSLFCTALAKNVAITGIVNNS